LSALTREADASQKWRIVGWLSAVFIPFLAGGILFNIAQTVVQSAQFNMSTHIVFLIGAVIACGLSFLNRQILVLLTAVGFGYDDGLYAALRVMEYLSEKPRQSLSQLMSAFPERFYTEDTYISTHNTNPQAVLQEIERRGNSCDAELSKIDGIRLDFKNGFGIIRASNTGEFFTVRFDADHPTHLNNIRQTFASMLSDRYPMIAQDILLAH